MPQPSTPPPPASPPSCGEEPDIDSPYTGALLLKLSAALGEIAGRETPAGLAHAVDAADILHAHGLALVEPERARMWIDERVYCGALFRLRLAEQPPSITLPQDLMPDANRLVRIAIDVTPSAPVPRASSTTDAADPGATPSFLDRRKAAS